MSLTRHLVLLACALALWQAAPAAFAATSSSPEPPAPVFVGGYPTTDTSQRLKEELLFQNAVQTYLWALPALNIESTSSPAESSPSSIRTASG